MVIGNICSLVKEGKYRKKQNKNKFRKNSLWFLKQKIFINKIVMLFLFFFHLKI